MFTDCLHGGLFPCMVYNVYNLHQRLLYYVGTLCTMSYENKSKEQVHVLICFWQAPSNFIGPWPGRWKRGSSVHLSLYELFTYTYIFLLYYSFNYDVDDFIIITEIPGFSKQINIIILDAFPWNNNTFKSYQKCIFLSQVLAILNFSINHLFNKELQYIATYF